MINSQTPDTRAITRSLGEDNTTYRRLVDSITDYAIYMLDVEGIVSSWNAGAQRAKGYTASEIVGRHFGCFYTEEDQLAGKPDHALAVAASVGKFQSEGWRLRKDNTRFWAHVVINPVYDDHDTLIGFAKVTRDCTEARQVQQLSHDQERRFRLLVEGVTDYAIYMLDCNGIVSNWNAGAQRAKGYAASEVVGRHFSMFYEEADQRADLPGTGLETARVKGKFEAEGWRVRKDRTRFWAHVTIQPIYDDLGELFGFAKITRDCSGQRLAALALAETTRNLDLALDNMLHGLCLFDRHARLVLCNDQFNRLLSLPSEALVPGTRLPALLRQVCRIAYPAIDDEVERARQFRRSLTANIPLGKHEQAVEFGYRDRQIALVTRVLQHGGWLCIFEDVTERHETARRIQHLAHHDVLTGLPNRVAFQDAVRNALSQTRTTDSFALLYLDLDRFKAVNDALGHHIGDELLKAVAQRLSATLRDGDQVARLSGDEFTIVQRNCRHIADATSLADRCIRQLTRPFELFGNEVTVGVSIGIVVHPQGETNVNVVLQQADLALYKAKREGRNCYRLYEFGMNDPLRLRNELEDDLRRGLRNREFELHYQPIVDAVTGSLTACEALARWPHPKRGNVPPTEFIPVAEERGLMPEFGAWVLEQACRDAMLWPSHVRVSVNVSPAQLMYEEFMSVLTRALIRSGLPPHRLELEITETVLLESSETPRQLLNAIRELGVGVAMDDFGTGYSSLSLLQSFPFTRIKIDRSFVSGLGENPKSLAIVRAITGLCESLGIPVIAEGIERIEQRDMLIKAKCSELQGFLFSRPTPNNLLGAWFE